MLSHDEKSLVEIVATSIGSGAITTIRDAAVGPIGALGLGLGAGLLTSVGDELEARETSQRNVSASASSHDARDFLYSANDFNIRVPVVLSDNGHVLASAFSTNCIPGTSHTDGSRGTQAFLTVLDQVRNGDFDEYARENDLDIGLDFNNIPGPLTERHLMNNTTAWFNWWESQNPWIQNNITGLTPQ